MKHPRSHKYLYSQGQSLLEVIVALGVMVLLVMGLISATTVSLRTGTFGKQKSTAIKYAQEGLELVRSQRDTEGWATFRARAGSTYCLLSTGVFSPGACTTAQFIDAVYSRQVSFVWNNRMEATVTVSWTDTSTHSTTLTSYFTQWK